MKGDLRLLVFQSNQHWHVVCLEHYALTQGKTLEKALSRFSRAIEALGEHNLRQLPPAPDTLQARAKEAH